MTDVETIVVGAGAMGSAAAWALVKARRDVLLLEQFGRGHDRGASHGAYRNFNVMYAQHHFQRLLVTSSRLWRELEHESGASLLELVGMVKHGVNFDLPDTREALQSSGFEFETLEPRQAERRWPGIRFDTSVLYSPDGGRVRAADSVEAMQDCVSSSGGDVRFNCSVLDIEIRDDDHAAVTIDNDGTRETVTASTVVVTAGAWSARLLSKIVDLPSLEVRQVQPAHFPGIDPTWPSFSHITDGSFGYRQIYGVVEPGLGVKTGWHDGGFRVDPDRRVLDPDPGELRALQRYVATWLPGLDASDPKMVSCTYTMTANSDFIVDRVGPLVVGAGFSGHGFKFTPAIGEIISDLAQGRHRRLDEFRLATHHRYVPHRF